MNIKYPKTEIMFVLGSKVYPLYTSLSVNEVHNHMCEAHREDFLVFPTAIKLPEPKVKIDYNVDYDDYEL